MIRHPLGVPLFIVSVLLVANYFIWGVQGGVVNSHELTVSFLDVGQGDAIFIETPEGNQMLIDGGPDRSVLRALGEVMPAHDRTIDVVVVTHFDADHIGGLPDIFERFTIHSVVVGESSKTTSVADVLKIELTDEEVIVPRRGTRLHLGAGVVFDILAPIVDGVPVDDNAGSVVGRLVYGETEFLFTGDAPQAIEELLVALDDGSVVADVLKLGHHGSKTSTSELFVDVVSPQYAVVSASDDNRYGHPHSEVLDVISKVGAEDVWTAKNGTITFVSDGNQVRLK